MKALCWHGKGDMRYEQVPDPKIQNPRDAIIKHYLPNLKLVEEGKIDPSFVITDWASLEDGSDLYKKFRDEKDGCIKVVLKP